MQGWELLVQRSVTNRVDDDRIVVTRAKGTFKSIMIEVRRHGVDFQRVVVHLGNGGDQEIALRASIPVGGESRVIDIEGRDRVIRSIDLWYDARTGGAADPQK